MSSNRHPSAGFVELLVYHPEQRFQRLPQIFFAVVFIDVQPTDYIGEDFHVTTQFACGCVDADGLDREVVNSQLVVIQELTKELLKPLVFIGSSSISNVLLHSSEVGHGLDTQSALVPIQHPVRESVSVETIQMN